MERDASAFDARDAYHLLTAVVAPRPIAWVTTQGPDGVVNAAPFSWYNAVCADPMMVMLAIHDRKDGSPKDTVRNARATGELVVNAVAAADVEAAVATSADYPPEVSEPATLGLPLSPSVRVRPPRLASSPVHLECRLERELTLGRRQDLRLLFCEVLHVGLDDAVLDARGRVDAKRLVLAARLGGAWYADTRAPFEVRRPEAPSPPERQT
ncbi:MAG TPA: flavin reductase family protein [Candidatus Thermoplasmatota archaeon]|nr:flavin reductase family protein [Candidatus Thermoplasmatota archaeon]